MTAIYRVGERVDGLYDENTDEMWYPGRVRSVHLSDDTFEVVYDDGEVEMNVRQEFLRQHVAGTICVGTRVLCRYDGGEEFYPGQVSDVQEDGRYTIAYDDGEVEEDVPLEHITEPTENDEEKEEPAEEDQASNNAIDYHQQPEYHEEMEDEVSDDKSADNNRDIQQESEENVRQDSELGKTAANSPAGRICPAFPAPSSYEKSPQSISQAEDHPDATPAGVSTERAYIIESLQLLEKRLGDAASTKSVLSTLVKQMRAYPQITADLVHERGGERLLIDALKFHQSHAVIQCYGCVLLRRLCFLCVKSTHFLLHNGIVELVIQAMNAFAEDAILQASACGALAVFTRVHAGLNILIEFQVAQLVLSTLIYHKTYSVHTRQVHYYACEVLLELCELDDLQTLNLLCGEQEEDFTGDMSPISLLLFLLRQGLSLDDKKACCAVGSLLMCLAASGRRAAALILSLNGLAELSTVMARYPTEPSIQKYSAAASKQIALCSVRQSPTKRIKDTATEILREAESIESTPREPLPKKRTSRRATNTGKRKSNPSTRYGAAANPSRGSAYNSSTPYRGAQAFSKSPYGQIPSGFGEEMNSYNYPVSAPQQPSSLVILDGGIGMDSGFGSANKYRRLSKEDRQSELFDAYGIQEIPNGRPYGTKRAQLRAHLASAETTWATPPHRIPSSMKPTSRGSEHLDYGRGWDFATEEHPFELESRQPRGGKRKKKNPSVRAAFQVKLENENQLRVSREARAPYPSPQRLGAATKRAAKARHKRIAATSHSSVAGKSSNTSSESLNDYATQLFQDNASRGGTHFPARSRLTPREKEEIRERERLSFAEKLHKMIDKAKSTLASSHTMDAVPLPPKSSKAARKTPLERTRTLANTPKQVDKEVLSPREVVETRPAKPTSRTNKRSEPSSVPVVPRPKPTIARNVVTPKTTDARSRGNKATKAVPSKTAEKTQDEKLKAAVVKSTPPEATVVANTLEADEPHPAEATEDVAVAEETKPTVPVEPETSSTDVAVEMEIDATPSNVTSELQAEPTPPKAQTVVSGERSNEELPDNDVGVENAAMVVETEAADVPMSPPQAVEEDVAPEPTADAPDLSEETVDERQAPWEEPAALEPTVDLSSGGSATVDAMYGDAFNDFDDNVGEDEDMTAEAGADPDDTHTPATEISDPKDNLMQESKSGEALYDDYDEFDEDEPPQDENIEVDDTPVAGAAAEITVLPTETEPDPVKNVPEGEGEAEAPTVAAEDTASAFSEGGDGTNVDGNGGDINVQPSESEPGPRQEPQPEVLSNADAPEEAPSDIEPIVGSVEDQKSVNLDIDSATVPSDKNAEESGPYSNPVDDPDNIPVDDVAENAPDGGTGEKVGTEPSTDAELAEAEVATEDDGASAQLESEISEPKLPDEAVVSVDPTAVEAQQDEEDRTDITVQQDTPQMSDEAVTSLEQDEEAKKLTADNSVASVHSAAYDEDNFDDDEAHDEADLSEAVDSSAVEETVQVAEPRQGDESPDTMPNPEPIAAVSTGPEDESKTLVANSSELSVQSAGYDDDGFEDGAQEDPQADTSEDKAPGQEPSGDENTDSVTVDTPIEPASEDKPISPDENEAPGATAETLGDEDFENTAADGTLKETAPGSAPETVDVPSELKQPDPTTTPESEVVAEPSIVAGNDSPDSLAHEETAGNVQEPANVEAKKDEEAGQVDENAGSASEGETIVTAEPDESSTPVSTENPATDPSAITDTLEDETSKTNTPTDATSAQEDETSETAMPAEDAKAQNEAEAGEEPATYDDDNFADEEEVALSVAPEEPDLVEQEELKIQPFGQPSDEIGESAAAASNNEENTGQEGSADMEDLSHPRQSEEDAVDSSVALDKPDDSIQGLTPEAEIPSENVVEPPAESEDNVDLVTGGVDDSVPVVKPSEVELTATPTEQPRDQIASVSPDAENPETENSADTPQVESMPDPEAESDTHVSSNDIVPDQSAATTGETREEISAESEPRPGDIFSDADIPVELSVDDTQGEVEYDAEFDDAENDAPLDDTPPKNEPIQDEIGTNEETMVEYEDAGFDDAESDAVTLPKDDNGPIQNEVGANEEATPEDNVNDTTEGETADQPTDVPTTETDTNGDKQPTGSTVADVDDPNSANVDFEASNAAGTEEGTDVNASQYEEDFPDALPKIQDTEPITTVEAPDSDNTPTEPEPIAIESNLDNEPSSSQNASELAEPRNDVVAVPDPPMDELYDDGFDDDNAALSVDPNDSSSPIETSSAANGAPVVNGDSDGLDGNTDSMQVEADMKVEESDVADTIEAQQTEMPVQNEPIESESVKTEKVEAVSMEPKTVETAPVDVEVDVSAPIEPGTVGTVPVEPPLEVDSAETEPEASTPTVETCESGVELEPGACRDEVVEPIMVQSEVGEVESGQTGAVESEGVELENSESQAAGPIEETLSGDSHDADPELIEPSPVESEAGDANASVSESQEEGKLTDPSVNTSATPEARQECFESEPSEVPVPIEDSDSLPVIEAPVEAEDTPTEDNGQSLTGDRSTTGGAKEEAPQKEKSSNEEVVEDPLQNEEPSEDTTSSSIEVPPAEIPVKAAADEQLKSAQSDVEEVGRLSFEDAYLADENPDGAVNLADPVSQENQEVAVGADQVNENPVGVAETPEPTVAILEPSNDAQPAVKDQALDEPDYAEDAETYEAQALVHESDLPSQKEGAESPNDVAKNDTAHASENTAVTTSEAVETPEPTEVGVEPTHKEQLTVEDEASDEPDYTEDNAMEDESPAVVKDESKTDFTPKADELAIENESPEPDQTVTGSEGPKTEDQYDDDDGYNEFDDQENDSPPTVEVPVAATAAITKAPATEDEYDEYENGEYGEEEKPSETPRLDPVATKSTRSSPPASAREEEIDEVAEDPEEAEEDAYADDQDEYEEDEVPTPVPKSSSPPKLDKAAPKQAEAEASADEYEDDNEEEDYADDEIEDSSPPKSAPAVRAAKSDDEMEEELESEEDYASD